MVARKSYNSPWPQSSGSPSRGADVRLRLALRISRSRPGARRAEDRGSRKLNIFGSRLRHRRGGVIVAVFLRFAASAREIRSAVFGCRGRRVRRPNSARPSSRRSLANGPRGAALQRVRRPVDDAQAKEYSEKCLRLWRSACRRLVSCRSACVRFTTWCLTPTGACARGRRDFEPYPTSALAASYRSIAGICADARDEDWPRGVREPRSTRKRARRPGIEVRGGTAPRRRRSVAAVIRPFMSEQSRGFSATCPPVSGGE